MIRLAIRVRRDQAELVLADLLELAPGGVEETDLGDAIEYAVYGPPGELPELPDLRAAAGGALVEIVSREVPDDWADRWRAFHRPLVLGDRLAVRPPWEPEQAGVAAERQLVIDPGQAFGTGAHATTRLCLELLLELAAAGGASGAFADLGCGSGVLAIAAARLGWAPVLGVDHDPASVAATLDNAAVNGVQVRAERVDLMREPPPLAPTVAANLLRPLLLVLAEQLPSVAGAPPQTLVASGLLAGEADELVAAFGRSGLVERERRVAGDWAALLLVPG